MTKISTMLGTIVVATDFSANARLACAWAEKLAQQHDAKVVLVHGFTTAPGNAPALVQLPQAYHDDIRARLTSQLDDEAKIVRRSGVTVHCELVAGGAADVVTAVAAKYGADIIVAGTRGRTGLTRLFLGSTAARLMAIARCPVLTVRPTDAGSPRMVRCVLVPIDFSADAAAAAETATRILGGPVTGRRIVLLHAYQVPYEATYLPAPILEDAIAAADAKAKGLIEERAADLRATGIQIDTVCCEGDPAQAILDYAKSMNADLIAMGTHGCSELRRLFVGSIAERVVASAPCPVLTVGRGSA